MRFIIVVLFLINDTKESFFKKIYLSILDTLRTIGLAIEKSLINLQLAISEEVFYYYNENPLNSELNRLNIPIYSRLLYLSFTRFMAKLKKIMNIK
jgi:hypothetical protein